MFNTSKTVAGVMAAFTKTIGELKRVEESNLAESDRQKKIALAAAEASAQANSEAEQARRIAGRLEALLSSEAAPAEVSA